MTETSSTRGLVLQPFRALRPAADGAALAPLLCPPYDVIDAAQRAALLARDPANAVSLILPETSDGSDAYAYAAAELQRRTDAGTYTVDDDDALYVYEMSGTDGTSTRGLVGAVELRDPDDGVILPHENTMAGPVADRLALMSATRANLEPIYLVYDGGGAASTAVAAVSDRPPLATTTTDDGITHRLWAITDPTTRQAIAADLGTRRALIADGHHRYATYRRLQQQLRDAQGPGPWDYGLTLLVDSSSYGPQVHAIHRVLIGVDLDSAQDAATRWGMTATPAGSADEALAGLEDVRGFAVVLGDGSRSVIVSDTTGAVREASEHEGETATLTDLDVTVLHRGLVERVLQLSDDVDTVGYAHSVEEALAAAADHRGTAVLLRPTPVAAVAAVAAAGARMPRKSTLFTPKPASGLLMRRFADA